MDRREFIVAAGALGLVPFRSYGQAPAPRFADMHAHLGFRYQLGYRAQMEKGGLLLVAESVTSEGGLLSPRGGRLQMTREVQPGELRNNFEGGFARRCVKHKRGPLLFRCAFNHTFASWFFHDSHATI